MIEKDLTSLLLNETSPRIPDPNNPVDHNQRNHAAKMSDKERMRLDELSDELVKKKKKVDGMRMYAAANRKIHRVLRDKRPPKHRPSLKSGLMETVFEVERRETRAANVIQRCYHNYLFQKALDTTTGAGATIAVIQARVRGVITRKWLSVWYESRFAMVVQWQARIRRFLSNKVREKWGERSGGLVVVGRVS